MRHERDAGWLGPGLVLWRAMVGATLALGCAQIFGIDEACVIGEPGCAGEANGGSGGAACAPGDPGCAPDSDIEGSCSRYCSEIGEKCSATPQYDDARPECQSLCRYFPRAAGESPQGNTFECRLDRIIDSSGDGSECLQAGRGGEGVCGSNCEAYCSLLQALCPAHFSALASSENLADDAAECANECGRLRDRGAYDPAVGGEDEFDEPGDATVQCRLWHLGAAAIEVEQFGGTVDNLHCDHAIGVSRCNPPAP